MKPITKQINGKNQKWLLCAALLLALGTQSYYQVSSVQFDSIELASEDATMEKIELKLKLKAKEKEIEEKVLAENKEEQKPDNLKLYDFYKTHEILKKAQAQATDDESDKEKKLNHALAFATKAKAFLAKVLQDNKDKAEEIALYVSYKKYELKNKIEAKSETDKKIKADKLLKAKDYNIKAAAIAASLHEAEDASVEISASNKVTEGTASAAEPCEGGCGLPFDLSIAEFKKISERAEVPVETPKEKRERLAEEKREARLEKAEAKRQALKDKKEALNDKFTEQAEALAEECKENQEVGCATAKMTELLMDFTGDQKVDKSVVNKAFNQYVAKDLRKLLGSTENSQILAETLYQLNSDIPAGYQFLKEKVIDITKGEVTARALEVNQNFKMAAQLTDAKRPLEAQQYINAGHLAANAFNYDANLILANITGGLQASEDNLTMRYVNQKYIPDMRILMSTLGNLNGIDANKLNQDSSTSTLSDGNTTSNASTTLSETASTRNGRSGSTNTPNTGGAQLKTTRSGNSSSISPESVTVGTPSLTRQGNRTSK